MESVLPGRSRSKSSTMKPSEPHGFSMLPCLVILAVCCITGNQALAQRNPLLGAGNSYVNISKRTTGGFVQVGDTLEIRSNYFFGGNYNIANARTLFSVRYYDSVPKHTTMLTGTNDSLRLITNEGLTFRRYTRAGGDDAATFNVSPPAGRYQIRINIGSTPTAPHATDYGLITNTTGSSNVVIGTYRPVIFGGTLIMTAFRVRVTGNAGDTIVLAAPRFVYRRTSGGADTVITGTRYQILINGAEASTLCPNGLGNNLAAENGGTFDSGTVQNRPSGPAFPIPSYDYKPLSRTTQTSDGSYAIVNNLSPNARTNFNARMQPNCTAPTPIPVNDSCGHRMHGGFWDIIGDHTGTNNAIGNMATPAGTRGGYMLVVNADVVTSEAYRQTVTDLCPDTYYEFSAWLRNVCRRCGIDSTSTQRFNPGVLPNLTFSINGIDIYSTGQLDTIGWQKKGFIFKTGPSVTNAVISIRNNAPGGGGNDWAIDDIAIGTCGPSMLMNYRPFLLGCNNGVLVQLADTIRYTYNPNYAWYRWERSTDGGATWGPPPTPTEGQVTPQLVNGMWQYVTEYPPFLAYAADSGHRYRVVVATSAANLYSSSCSFTDGNDVYLRLIHCPGVVDATVLQFTGNINRNDRAQLAWYTKEEQFLTAYEIESSVDGRHFRRAGRLAARNNVQMSEYLFEDPIPVQRSRFYRLKIINNSGQYKYSPVIVLSRNMAFELASVINPFNHQIQAELVVPKDAQVDMRLLDSYGNLITRETRRMHAGLNQLTYPGLHRLAAGMYIIQFQQDGLLIQRRIVKLP